MLSNSVVTRLSRQFLSLQFLAFVGVGVTAAAANFGSRILFDRTTTFGVAVFLAFFVGVSVAFVLNALFVFRGSDRPLALQMRDFLGINLVTLPVYMVAAVALNALFLKLGFGEWSDEVAHALSLALPVFITFLIYKFFTFAKNTRTKT